MKPICRMAGRAATLILPLIYLACLATACRRDSEAQMTAREGDSLHLAYYEDAARMAVRNMKGIGSSNAWIPKDSIAFYQDKLVEAYLFAHSNRDRDSLEQVLKMHTAPSPDLHNLALKLEAGTGWADAWNSGAPETGNTDVNRLIRQYNLRLLKYLTAGNEPYAIVGSLEPLNTYALAEMFMKVKGVKVAEPQLQPQGREDIQAVHTRNDGVHFSYMKADGTCAANCIYNKTWVLEGDRKGRFVYSGLRTTGR